MHVAHRGLDVLVPHPRLYVRERRGADSEGAERVAQVVRDDRVVLLTEVSQASAPERDVEGVTDGAPVRRPPISVQKTRSPGPVKRGRRLRPSSATRA